MATRPIVPRANGEGSLGVTSKYWGNTFTQKMNGANAVDMADFSTATLRQPSTAQSIGDIRYHATLPAGWYLECTTAGTTGSGTLTITSPTVGGTVSDGTVTWTVHKNASTQDLTGYLPLSGGAMKSENAKISVDSNSSVLVLNGGTDTYNGATIGLFGKNHSSFPGQFVIEASTANNNACDLYGHPNGTLTWGSNSLDKSAVVAESLGANGYRKYASGLIEQWGNVGTTSSNYIDVTLPVSMWIRGISITRAQNPATSATPSAIYAAGQADNSNATFRIRSNTNVENLFWHAIGYV